MSRKFIQIIKFSLFLLLFGANKGHSQFKIRGTVYDSTRNYPMELVSVLSTSGAGTVTNSDGQYEITVSEKDSIWFSYLNKPTIKFPVLKISNPFAFDISLKVSVPELKEVRVRPRNYKEDSLQNRKDYAKVFNYQKGLQLRPVTPQYGAGAGFDVNEIINAFRFKKNRQMAAFQKRLLQQEQDKFIEHRFNKALVRRLTGLTEPELDTFMLKYKPPYFFTAGASDYDFQWYIKKNYERYKQGLPPIEFEAEEDQ